MRPKDIALFLLGNRGAIERVAGSWWSLLIGAILVVGSGIARNYDHLDLLRNPEWLYGPFVASFITSLIVFACAKPFLIGRAESTPSKVRHYLSFLCLYWMTAPCAWIYGIPVESLTDLLTATKWNIAFLAIVSLWRVALMTRALAVITQASPFGCLLAILFPSSVIMCVGSYFKGMSLVGIMGGVRLPPHTALLREAAVFTTTVAFGVVITTLVIGCIASSRLKRGQKPLPWRTEKAPVTTILVALFAVGIGAALSIPRQRLVQRNHHLNILIKSEDYSEAIRYASQFEKFDFSTIHYLPPNPYTPYGSSWTYQKLLPLLNGSEPDWLRETWINQCADSMLRTRYGNREKDARLINHIPELKVIILRQANEEEHLPLLESIESLQFETSPPPPIDGSNR